MSAMFLIDQDPEILLYLRLCIDIGPICNQHFDYFCLPSEGCYVQCCVSFLKWESDIWKEYKIWKHDNAFKNMVQSNIYSISLDKILLLNISND